ncbi:MAG TPA: hypothetical protein VIN04_07590 [Myxococcota bacterium]
MNAGCGLATGNCPRKRPCGLGPGARVVGGTALALRARMASHPLVRCIRSAALAVLLAAPPALGLPSFELTAGPGDMQNNWNVPKLTLTNTSSAGESIVSFSLTIGHLGFVYDFVADLSSSPAGRAANVATEALTGATLVAGDRVNGTGSVRTLVWSFEHFTPGESLVFEVDLDRADGSVTWDARTIWFDNGAQPNAVAEVVFSNGATVGFEMPDTGGAPTMLLFALEAPEPGAAALLGVGLAGLTVLGSLARPRR